MASPAAPIWTTRAARSPLGSQILGITVREAVIDRHRHGSVNRSAHVKAGAVGTAGQRGRRQLHEEGDGAPEQPARKGGQGQEGEAQTDDVKWSKAAPSRVVRRGPPLQIASSISRRSHKKRMRHRLRQGDPPIAVDGLRQMQWGPCPVAPFRCYWLLQGRAGNPAGWMPPDGTAGGRPAEAGTSHDREPAGVGPAHVTEANLTPEGRTVLPPRGEALHYPARVEA
jgi:hypothetical protein